MDPEVEGLWSSGWSRPGWSGGRFDQVRCFAWSLLSGLGSAGLPPTLATRSKIE